MTTSSTLNRLECRFNFLTGTYIFKKVNCKKLLYNKQQFNAWYRRRSYFHRVWHIFLEGGHHNNHVKSCSDQWRRPVVWKSHSDPSNVGPIRGITALDNPYYSRTKRPTRTLDYIINRSAAFWYVNSTYSKRGKWSHSLLLIYQQAPKLLLLDSCKLRNQACHW